MSAHTVSCRLVFGGKDVPVEMALCEYVAGFCITNVTEASVTGLEPGTYALIEIWVGAAKYELLSDPIAEIETVKQRVFWEPGSILLTMYETRIFGPSR